MIMDQPELFQGKRVGIILTGGNVDLDNLPW
jgi:threonine dehydratase